MSHEHHHPVTTEDLLWAIFGELLAIKHLLFAHIHHFTPIQETSMVTLSAGNTAVFSTTPIPSTSVPNPSSIVWSSSDLTNAPAITNPADPTGLSASVTFASDAPAGVSFTLTISYTNTDGTKATQSDSFTTVEAPSPDVTGFADITQTA